MSVPDCRKVNKSGFVSKVWQRLRSPTIPARSVRLAELRFKFLYDIGRDSPELSAQLEAL